MASMDSVHQKMYRARDHYLELRDVLVQYYESKPIEFIVGPGSTPEQPTFILREKSELPKRFGLMFGDSIQCQRSCLDYLIYELVEIAGNPHHNQNQFPIALTIKSYKDKLRAHYLDGVGSEAVAVIESLQPYHSVQPDLNPLAVMDKLANINKHRRVILTNFVSSNIAPTQPLTFPHIRGVGKVYSVADGRVFDAPVWGYVTVKDERLANEEIITAIERLSEYLITKVFPLFEHFFV